MYFYFCLLQPLLLLSLLPPFALADSRLAERQASVCEAVPYDLAVGLLRDYLPAVVYCSANFPANCTNPIEKRDEWIPISGVWKTPSSKTKAKVCPAKTAYSRKTWKHDSSASSTSVSSTLASHSPTTSVVTSTASTTTYSDPRESILTSALERGVPFLATLCSCIATPCSSGTTSGTVSTVQSTPSLTSTASSTATASSSLRTSSSLSSSISASTITSSTASLTLTTTTGVFLNTTTPLVTTSGFFSNTSTPVQTDTSTSTNFSTPPISSTTTSSSLSNSTSSTATASSTPIATTCSTAQVNYCDGSSDGACSCQLGTDNNAVCSNDFRCPQTGGGGNPPCTTDADCASFFPSGDFPRCVYTDSPGSCTPTYCAAINGCSQPPVQKRALRELESVFAMAGVV